MQLEGKETELGIALYSKNFNNSNKWHLIIEEGNSEPYGTGWRYIKKGENLGENVISEYSWLLNTNTGEMKKLEEGRYTELSVDSSLGTKEGLIFNLDPSVIEGNEGKSISELKNILGNNVELYGFDDMDESGLTSSSFNFDGNDDWIKVKYDDEHEKDEMIEHGFTFDGDILQEKASAGGFGWYNGNDTSHALLHFQVWRLEKKVYLRWSPFPKHQDYDYIPSVESMGGCWQVGPERTAIGNENKGWNANATYELEGEDNDFYITVTLDPSKTSELNGHPVCAQTLYVNGRKVSSGWYYKENWDSLSEYKEQLKYFCIGKSSQNADNQWSYGKIKCYTLRLYSRALSDDEVNDNYLKSKSYYDLLENE